MRYGARKAVWLRRSAYRRHGAPAPRNGAPDRKMPCSMAALPRNPFLGKQNCTLNTPRARLAPTGSFSAERCHSIPLGARGARDGTGQDDGMDGTGRRVNSPQSFPWMWGEPQHLAKHPLKSQRATVPAKRTAPAVPPLRCPLVPAPQTTPPGLPPPVCRAESGLAPQIPLSLQGLAPRRSKYYHKWDFFPPKHCHRALGQPGGHGTRAACSKDFWGTPLSNPTAPAAPSPTASSVWP